VIKLTLGLVELRLSLQISGMLGNRDIRIPSEFGQQHLGLIVQRLQPLERGVESGARLIEGLSRRYAPVR